MSLRWRGAREYRIKSYRGKCTKYDFNNFVVLSGYFKIKYSGKV